MAGFGDVTVKADSFFTDTRLKACVANCKHNHDGVCNLKTVSIDRFGECACWEVITEDTKEDPEPCK